MNGYDDFRPFKIQPVRHFLHKIHRASKLHNSLMQVTPSSTTACLPRVPFHPQIFLLEWCFGFVPAIAQLKQSPAPNCEVDESNDGLVDLDDSEAIREP
jgi:hypothetical protein